MLQSFLSDWLDWRRALSPRIDVKFCFEKNGISDPPGSTVYPKSRAPAGRQLNAKMFTNFRKFFKFYRQRLRTLRAPRKVFTVI
jgi:hypothetical protein